jgi:hypothetical protein
VQNLDGPQVNLLAAWIGIVVGLASGAALGLGFQRPDWLGGYAGFRRRLYRLGHISLFGLALLNLAFFFTAQILGLRGGAIDWASLGFLLGAVTMPLCCLIMAHWPGTHSWFVVPVGSLLTACSLVVWKVIEQVWRSS